MRPGTHACLRGKLFPAAPFQGSALCRGSVLLAGVLACVLFVTGSVMEALAVRPPPKPLDIANLQSMVAEAVVIASGTVTGLTQSRTLEGRVEVVTIHAILKPAIILKGNKDMTTIEVEESYRQFAAREAGVKSGAGRVIAMKAGPRPAVGSYEEGARLLLFLAPISGSKKYRPVGSGNYDAYLGVFHLTPEGVKAQGFALDKEVSAHSSSEPDFLDYVSSLTGGVK